MAPDYAQRAPPSSPRSSAPGPAPANPGPAFTADQARRWFTLASLAADEAGLPADPEFRAAFTSYLDWSSRAGAAPAKAEFRARCPVGTGARPARPPPRAHPTQGGTPAQASADDQPPVALAGPGQTVSFEAHIKPLFRARDRQSMTFAFDLWSYADVKANAAGIGERLRNGHHALRRRLAAGENRRLQPVGRVRVPALTAGVAAG